MTRTNLAALFLLLLSIGAIASSTARPDRAWSSPALYELEYRVKLSGAAPAGSTISLWVPYPAENPAQKVLDAKVESPWPWQLRREPRFGNRMVHAEGTSGPEVGDLVMRFRIERRPYNGIQIGDAPFEGTLRPSLYSTPDRLVPLEGLIRKIAKQESEGLRTPGEKIRAFYDYVYRTMSYDKSGTGWGRGDAVWACTTKRGNCTDFHSLFIGMLRSEGIPARFLIGLPVPDAAEGEIPGYHCWAEFFDESRGWLPVDASEAKKKSLKEEYFGALPNDRIEFTLGRDLVLDPPQSGEPLNYFIYPYAEAGGKPLPQVPGTFRFRRLPSGVSS